MKNKMATERWNFLKREFDCVINIYVPTKKQRKRSRKKHLSRVFQKRLDISKICGGFINIREMIKIMTFTKRHYRPGAIVKCF